METPNHKDFRSALVLGEIGLIHSLAKDGIPVYTGTEIEDNPSLYSRFSQKRIFFSDYTSEKFIDELCEFGKSQDQKMVIFSDNDHAILNIVQNQERLKPYFLFSFPPADKVRQLLDRQLFCDLITRYDLPAPQSVTLSSVGDLREKPVSDLTYPCIIKPAFKEARLNSDFRGKAGGYQKAIKCETYKELERIYIQNAKINLRVVVQEFIEGKENEKYSVNMYIDNEGALKGYFIAQKLRTYPMKAGKGCYIKTVEDAEIIDKAKTIAGKLDLKGLLNIQFKREERSGEPVLLDIHTRNSVWSYLGTAAGVNLAAMQYRELNGEKMDIIPEYEPEVTYIFLENDIKAFLQNFQDRQIPVYRWIGSYFKKFVLSGFQWNDPLPFIAKVWFFFKRRFKKLSMAKTFLLSFKAKNQTKVQAHYLEK